MSYKTRFNFEHRSSEFCKIKSRYVDRIPIIVEQYSTKSKTNVFKNKYLSFPDFTVGQFQYYIRKKYNLAPEKALIFFVGNNTIAQMEMNMIETYTKHKDTDGFLYMTISEHETFG